MKIVKRRGKQEYMMKRNQRGRPDRSVSSEKRQRGEEGLAARGVFKRGGADGWKAARDELVMRIRMKMLCRSYRVDQSQPGHTGEDTGVKKATDGAGRHNTRFSSQEEKKSHSLYFLHYFIKSY